MLKVLNNGRSVLQSTFRTAPNIGLIKYWGKWHEDEIIPLNTNIGVTLNHRDVYTETTVTL
jgi:diphosphomevalonate decarboxylase